ncbi:MULTISPECIES: siroheme decarboxylase subunit beta [unclassified Candidatus Frackibacter]|uniref:siroheme decarboxylase subunit beta n=1 Tax=unclassified Candidatus Frackibacter TaxID=2648818 RepID=UPI00087E03AB|nr:MULTISPECIES: AsnC family transcriptional regulator [unclassified Candidatus Frackibacter]SDC41111.1 DNA-binding transcriptional regulator, Lrp family [Candidatus Frackibacter sp. WG11]SEM59802.1 DNA-binding transcriptional regulator, Lrp family [Candidatus Frackibacter sp. WG12]SFL62281.1 DNA-binding transcriptional regulator, Lrp family [Candidatus Frackibacter sp. WG13]
MAAEISELDKKIVKEIQEELPLERRPYQKIADKLGITEEELLTRLNKLNDEGKLRRMGVILYHRNSGYDFNGMVAWIVPPEKREEAGQVMATYDEISHVYQRPTYPDWPYSLFSMVHGKSKEDVKAVAEDISQKTGINDYTILYSTEELKKVSMKYFCED